MRTSPFLRLLTPALIALCAATPVLAQQAGEVLFRVDVDGFTAMSRPRVAPDGTIYFHTNNLYAISPAGEILWSRSLPDANAVDVGPDGTVYAGSYNTIYAYTPDGSLVWSFTEPPGGQGIMVGPTLGPDGNIYAVTDLGGLGALSLTPAGDLRWNVPGFGAGGGTGRGPVQFGPGNLYFAENWVPQQGECWALSMGLASVTFDGELDWCIPISGTSRTVATGDGKALIWEHHISGKTLYAYDAAGSEVWSHLFDWSPTGISSVGVGPDSRIYVWHAITTLAALTTDGELLWEEAQLTANPPLQPAVASDGRALVSGSEHISGVNGEILAVHPATGALLWKIPIEGDTAGAGATAAFSPDGEVVYVPVETASFEIPNQLWAVRVHDAGADFSVTLTPLDPPIEIPPDGGSYSYVLEVINESAETLTTDLWLTISVGAARRELGPITHTFAPGASVVRTLTQSIPGQVPAGTHTHSGSVGSYPVADVSDSFIWEKLAASSPGAPPR